MPTFPPVTRSPDVEAWLIEVLAGTAAPGVVSTAKPPIDAGGRAVRVRADLQQYVTPISRWCRVGISAWVLDAVGEPDGPAAAALANDLIDRVAAESGHGLCLHVDLQSGPVRTPDETDVEHAYAVLLLEVAVS